jgi:hypothetical protein
MSDVGATGQQKTDLSGALTDAPPVIVKAKGKGQDRR